jgi:hypothetical protein
MVFQESIMSSINDLLQGNTLISISGKAGTGKTSLSLFLIGNSLTSFFPYDGSCVWIQASEPFPKKRLYSMFGNDKKKSNYLIQNIYISPGSGPFTSYDHQLDIISKLVEKSYSLPPDLRFIVIDNVSHHLRYRLSKIIDLTIRSKLINRFYETIIVPLIFRCHKEKINLILIHEASFDVETQLTGPFYSKLYKRIRGVHINLSKSLVTTQRTMDLEFNNNHFSFKFNLTENGFKFSK